jgi:uroporphyrinogen-III synthase
LIDPLRIVQLLNFEILKIKRILISQPAPTELEKSPFFPLSKKYNIKLDYSKFFQVEGLTSLEFRLQKVSLFDHTAVIFTSKNSVDHYFRIAKDIRLENFNSMKFFSVSEAISLYLQKYIQFRKRKIFSANQSIRELIELIKKHREEKFFLPMSENSGQDTDSLKESLTSLEIDHVAAAMYRSVPSDLSMINPEDYEMFVLFSPVGVQGFRANFPDFEQGERLIAAFGNGTQEASAQAGFIVNIPAPTETAPSMASAIEEYLSTIMKPKRK